MGKGFDSFLKRLIFLGCCVFALCLPFDFPLKNTGFNIPFIKSFSILEVVFLAFLWELLIISKRTISVKKSPLLIPVAVFLLIHIYSGIFPSERQVWSLKYTFRFFGLGFVALLIINFAEDIKRLRELLIFLYIGAVMASIFVFIQYFFPYLLKDVQYFFKDIRIESCRIRGLFGWPTNMSVYLGTFIPLFVSCLFCRFKKNNSFKKAGYVLLICMMIGALVLSQARGWVLGLFCGLSALWILHLVKRKERSVILMSAAIAVIVIVTGIFTGMHQVVIKDLEPSEISRMTLVKDALGTIFEHPLRGIGADMFYWRHEPHRSHNIFLETAVNLGVFGLLALLWFFWEMFRIIGKGLLRAEESEGYYIRAGIFSSLVSFLAHSQVDYFWNLHEIAGLFWVLVGAGVCAAGIEETRSSISET